MEKQVLKALLEEESIGKIIYDEPMKNHTTFKIGGPVDAMIIPKNENEMINSVEMLRKNNIDFMIIGNGSNLLISDKGIRGVVIKTGEDFSDVSVNDNRIYCQSGAILSKISNAALENQLKNFEFASGIPGSIGGAMVMNAGAYGGEMKDVVSKVRALDKEGKVRDYTNEEMNFRYRNSRAWDEGLIVLAVELTLEQGNREEIKETIEALTLKRTTKQPLEYPSGGSTFKRPEGYYAGKLIDDSGLRGIRYKGAMVSDKHCGFVINVDNARCDDVLHLIDIVKKVVMDKFGVELEREIKLIGDE